MKDNHSPDLLLLLENLDNTPITTPQLWMGWRIAPITGGANNLIYRATRAEEDYAVKFTVRDGRNRAGRENMALSALQQVGLAIAPQPVFFDQDRFRQPVTVQTWVAGEVLTRPPETDAEWDALLQHFCAIHSLTPSQTTIQLERVYLGVRSGLEGKEMVFQHLEKLPPTARSASLTALLTRFETWTPPAWETPSVSLCRVDPNWRNIIRRSPTWASVDWENSGWGDPAFEIADLMTHPAYETISPDRWDWIIGQYTAQRQDEKAEFRIRTYYRVMLLWWVIRWARYLYEIPRGLDPRLVERPENWLDETEQKASRYMLKAEACLDWV